MPSFAISIQVIQGYPSSYFQWNTVIYHGPFLGFPNFFNGSLQQFPGTGGFRQRVYVELKLNTTKDNCKFVPKSCIATLTPNKFTLFRYVIIRNG